MASVLAYRRSSGGAAGDRPLDEPPAEHQTALTEVGMHALDGAKAREVHRRLLSWFYFERDRQAANRLEMATDHDFYDGDQWDPQDQEVLEDRRQLPVVYNELAPMCDWMIGTERRNKVDWDVLPRSEDDTDIAHIKTQTLKYVADVNHITHHRSKAFADAIKGGIGWVDDGARDDPTKDVLYSQYEDWRCVLHDSTTLDLWGDEGRYRFRWRWVDDDIAMAMFPDRRDKIRQATEDWAHNVDSMVDELDWQASSADATGKRHGSLAPLNGTSSSIDSQRRRVRLIEGQYREPMTQKFIADGPLRGALFDPRDKALVAAHQAQGGTIVDRVTMRVHVAVFTEAAMLSMGPSKYRHNKFSLTPFVCYIKGRDRQPYGMIRRSRTVQQDINKRASKANWLVNTNQLIGDRDAFEDWEEAREEAQDPQGVLPHKPGSKVEIRRDAEAARGQLEMMQVGVQSIQRNSVSQENLGRETNATSEVAIRARQLQGSVTTTEPFDNARLSVQTQGEKQLSLVEQFYSEEKVMRLTGANGPIQWVKLNAPEVQPDGSVRWLNDITASVADFVVSEADYAGTLRQVMFDSLMQLSQRLPPEIALKLLRMAFEYSDLPNKDDISAEIRRMTGEQDPTKKLSPEEQQQAQAAQQAQAEAAQIQRDLAMATLEEQQAKARKIGAEAEKVMAEIDTLRAGGGGDDMQTRIELAVAKVREQAASEIESLSQQLAKVTASNETAVMKVRSDADTAAEVERIRAASAERVAEIQAASDTEMQKLQARIDDLARMSNEVRGAVKEVEKKATAAVAAPAPAAATAPSPAKPAAEPGKRQLKVIRVNGKLVGAQVGNTVVTLKHDKDGKFSGGVVETKQDESE